MKTILVADDDEGQVRYLIEDLKQRYNVKYVSNGKLALERIEKGGLDGVILDLFMPPTGVSEDEGRQFWGDCVAIKARELFPNLALVLRSSDFGNSVETLKPYNVLCHHKRDSNYPILDYFQERFKE